MSDANASASTGPDYGDYLRALREARGMDPNAFAKALYGEAEVPKLASQLSNIWNWESGKSTPRGAILGKIANALGVSPKSVNPKHFTPSMMNRMLLQMQPAAALSEEEREALLRMPQDRFSDLDIEPLFLPQPDEKYGDWLKRVRIAKGFKTANDFARGAGFIGTASYPRYEKGLSKPAQESVEKIAMTLELPFALCHADTFERIQNLGDEATETYGEYLGRLRREAGFKTHPDIAKVWFSLGYAKGEASVGQIFSKWETGHVLPSTRSQERLAKLYGISAKTLDPARFKPGRLLPPTLKVVAPEIEPQPALEVDVERMQADDVQFDETSIPPPPPETPIVEHDSEFDGMPQFLKSHVDIFGVSKSDDPNYVRIKFDALVPRKTAGKLMKRLVKLTTTDLLGGEE